jgi:aryl-alcohol dehydrogenase-like predicted oxidoreductase
MKRRTLGRTGLEVSELCLGTATFCQEDWGSDETVSRDIVARFLEAGGNFVDTADLYATGRAEEILGRAIRERRDAVVVATKVGGPTGGGRDDFGLSRKHIIPALEASLRRLGTDHVDLYQVHGFDPITPIEETLRALDDCVRAGKVRALGCSNFAAWHLMKANRAARELGTARFDVLQPHYSLVCRYIEREHLPLCWEEDIAVLPWSPLGGGLLADARWAEGGPPPGTRAILDPRYREQFLSDRNLRVAAEVRALARERSRSPAHIALAWLRERPCVVAPVMGVRTVAQLEDNLAALSFTLDDEARNRLEAVSALPLVYPYDQIAAVRSWLASMNLEA